MVGHTINALEDSQSRVSDGGAPHRPLDGQARSARHADSTGTRKGRQVGGPFSL